MAKVDLGTLALYASDKPVPSESVVPPGVTIVRERIHAGWLEKFLARCQQEALENREAQMLGMEGKGDRLSLLLAQIRQRMGRGH